MSTVRCIACKVRKDENTPDAAVLGVLAALAVGVPLRSITAALCQWHTKAFLEITVTKQGESGG